METLNIFSDDSFPLDKYDEILKKSIRFFEMKTYIIDKEMEDIKDYMNLLISKGI